MKHIKRMLILNWHYIHKELIEFEAINFLTGKNASGKSTLIDAMQLLLLGDTAGHFFNKAANDKSKRTLLGYLKGELSDNDTSFNYLRNNNFTSHLVMEVFDDVQKKFSLFGFVADVTGDKYTHQFYTADCSLPDDLFVKDNYTKSIQDIKSYFKNQQIKFVFYKSNKEYRENFKFKMGQVNDKYFSLFKKAVPFSPITDIKKFITEFICDADNHVDITDMKDNIRQYEMLGSQVEEIEKMIHDLEVIDKSYKTYSDEKSKVYLYQFLIDYASFKNYEIQYKACQLNIEEHHKRLKKYDIELEKNEAEKESIVIDIEDTNIQIREYEPYRLAQSYKKSIYDHEVKLKTLEKSIVTIKERFLTRLIRWQAALSKTDNHLELKNEIHESITELNQMNFDIDIETVTSKLNDLSQTFNESYHKLKNKQENMQSEIEDYKLVIRNLKKGIKNYEPSVMTLKKLLTDTLSKKYNTDISVDILCELIEIKDERWKNAIEGYLHTQKFYLIVEPKYYIDALRIYELNKFDQNLYGVGLLDVEKIMKLELNIKSNSLAEEVDSSNSYAKAYMAFLLGKVMKCDDVTEIRHHKIGITDTCMLYKNYVASQMNPKRYNVPFIGRNATVKQIEIKTRKLDELENILLKSSEEMTYLKSVTQLEVFHVELIEDFGHARYDLETSKELEVKIKELNIAIEGIDMSSILTLQEMIKTLQSRQKIIVTKIIETKTNLKIDTNKLDTLNDKDLPYLMNKVSASGKNIDVTYKDDYVEERGRPRFDSEVKRLGHVNKIIDNFTPVLTGSQNKVVEYKTALNNLRSNFDRTYRRDLGAFSEDNKQYAQFLITLNETELPGFKDRIEEAKNKAMQEFKDDFISKLKSNIDDVTGQIKDLNAALKNNNFGKDKYRFSIKPNAYYRHYYDMIMDKTLMEGYSLFSHDFQMKYKDVIDELFKQIVDIGEGALSVDDREEMEKNIQMYTDYRTYLDFDLIVTNDSGDEQHLSKMIDKKSGGETQTPFYISVLASFSKIYRIHHPRNNNTMRMIIFDEAFSKMDHERIEESLKLLRSMKFQALISAPTEKIANIAPFADKTLCVLRNKQATAIREYDVIKDRIT